MKGVKGSLMAFAVWFTLAAAGQAHGFNTPLTRWNWWEDSEARKAVGLTEGQTAKIRKLVQSAREVMIDLRSAVEKKGLALERELEKTDYELDRALRAAEELQEARLQLERARTRLLLEIRAVLDGKQFFKVREMNRGPGLGGRISVRKPPAKEQPR